MKIKIIAVTITVLWLTLVGWLIFGRDKNPDPSENVQQDGQSQLSSQINSEGEVEVEVTPVEISESSDLWQFKIVLTTHSVELDQDLTKVTLLFDDKGNIYQPVSWEGTPPGGHHREGILSFRSIKPQTPSLRLVIQNVGETKEREFTWNLN